MVKKSWGPAMWLRIPTKSTITDPTDIKRDLGSLDRYVMTNPVNESVVGFNSFMAPPICARLS